MNRGLYVHVPFCASKCPYCDFYSERFSKEQVKQYKDAVLRNLGRYGETFETVYFGGGTPILICSEISEIFKYVSFTEKAEITVEANPCVSDYSRLELLNGSGVNRISFGVQSMNDSELRFLGRIHSVKQSAEAIVSAYKAGFRNISADIMLGLENQTKESLYNSVRALSELPVTHISAYMLKIEENTPFFTRKMELPDEDYTAELYLYTVEVLEKFGFHQYEISNFAKSGFECRHNLKYWKCEEYLGIGPAAHSFYNGKRFRIESNLKKFINNEFQEEILTDDNPGQFDEFVMLKLRLSEGLKYSDCENFGYEKEVIIERLNKIPKKYIIEEESGFSLTPEGFLISNSIIGKILGY